MVERYIETRTSRKTGIKSWASALSLALLAVGLGCKTGTPPDPNDPRDVAVLAPEVMRRNLKSASDNLNVRLRNGEIDSDEYRKLIRSYAADLLKSVDFGKIDPAKAWEYGDVVQTAEDWPLAEKVFTTAVANAKTTERKVNDTLRLAQAKAENGKVKEAVALVKPLIAVKAADAAPILPAVLLDIVPAGRGKGDDPELADLLEQAVKKHQKVIVDASTEAGQSFLMARPFHTRRAWRTVIDLYAGAGRDDKARAAAVEADRELGKQYRI